jgi:hypothetical protein
MRRLFALVCLLCCVNLLHAQAVPASPLLKLLSFVPDTADGQTGALQYTAFHQAALSYLYAQGVDQTAISMLYAKEELDADRNRLLTNEFVQGVLAAYPETPTLTGLTGRDIVAALVYGQPAARGVVIDTGETQNQITPKIAAALYEQSGYVAAVLDDVTAYVLVCPPAACAAPPQMQLAERNPANIFALPSFEHDPLVAYTATVASVAPERDLLLAGMEGHVAGTGTLAQQPDYAVLAQALDSVEGDLLQATILPPAIFATLPVITADTSEEFFAGIALRRGAGTLGDELKNYGALPPFNLAAVADYQTATSQSAVIAVVYPDAELAQLAAEELNNRFSTFRDELVMGQRERTLTEEFAGSYEVKVYHDAELSVSVVMIVLDYPLPELNNDGTVPFMGSIYHRLTRSIIQQAFYLLWQVELPDWFKEKYPAD